MFIIHCTKYLLRNITHFIPCFYQQFWRHRWSNTLNNDTALVRILFPTLYALKYKEYVVTPVQNEISGIKLERFSLLLIISWVSGRKRIGSRNIQKFANNKDDSSCKSLILYDRCIKYLCTRIFSWVPGPVTAASTLLAVKRLRWSTI
jgi:hypothetical protein